MDQPEKGYDVLFNPLTMPKFNLEDMLDVALHECTHLWVRGHHEEFTTLESQLRRGLRQYMPLAEIRKHVRVATDLSLPVKGAALESPVTRPPGQNNELSADPIAAAAVQDASAIDSESVNPGKDLEQAKDNGRDASVSRPWPPSGVLPAPF